MGIIAEGYEKLGLAGEVLLRTFWTKSKIFFE